MRYDEYIKFNLRGNIQFLEKSLDKSEDKTSVCPIKRYFLLSMYRSNRHPTSLSKLDLRLSLAKNCTPFIIFKFFSIWKLLTFCYSPPVQISASCSNICLLFKYPHSVQISASCSNICLLFKYPPPVQISAKPNYICRNLKSGLFSLIRPLNSALLFCILFWPIPPPPYNRI